MAEEKKNVQNNTPKNNSSDQFGEIVIELGDDRNRRFLYAGTGQELRGWWKKANLIGSTMDQRMSLMPDLPGMYICLDCKRKRLRILDPLNAPEAKSILTRAQRVHNEMFRFMAGAAVDVIEENLNDNKIKTHLYWMRRLIDSSSARVVSGDMPTIEQIEALPGFTRTEVWNSSARARKLREEDPETIASRNSAAPAW